MSHVSGKGTKVGRSNRTILPPAEGPDINPANLPKLVKQAFPQKIVKDKRGRLVDAATGERIVFVQHVDLSGPGPGPGVVDIHVPGDTFKMKCGKEYMVMPSGAIRRLSSRKGERE